MQTGGDLESAIACWRRVETQNAAYLPLVAEKLVQAYAQLGRPSEGVDLLVDYVNRYPSNDLLDVAFKHVSELRGIDAAHALARHQMETSPNLAGMTRLLEAQVATAEEPRRSELELMRTLVRQRTRSPALHVPELRFPRAFFTGNVRVAAAGKPMLRAG